jgi:hypothetical protein
MFPDQGIPATLLFPIGMRIVLLLLDGKRLFYAVFKKVIVVKGLVCISIFHFARVCVRFVAVINASLPDMK